MKHILQVAIAAILTFGFLLSGTSIEESVLTVDRLDYYVSTKKTYVLKPYFKEIKCDAGKDKDSEINTTVPSEPNDTYLENEQMLTVYNSQEKKIAIISVREYLVGTLSVEMPAYFNIEALKAQAVAARTYLYNKMKNGGCKKYGTYDICSSCGHCQGYQSVQKRKELWGASFEKYEQKMLDAVMTTEGECVSYNDDIINAMYHSSSAGRTEDYSQRYASVFCRIL